MSMSKEDGWENYYCYDCGKLLGHFYVGFGWKRPFRWLLMKYRTFWKPCSECAFKLRIRLRGGRVWMTSTPMIKNSYFQKLWDEAGEAIQDGKVRLPGEES